MLNRIFFSVIIASLVITFSYGQVLNSKYKNLELKPEFQDFTQDVQEQITCLTDNIYFESAYEPDKGKKAVAFVTLNRVHSEFYPNDICSVVKQKNPRGCQFSWYCDRNVRKLSYSKRLTNAQQTLYNDIRDLAIYIYLNYDRLDDPTRGALFYHADYVNPHWRKAKKQTVQIGRHIFYVRKDMI